MGAQRDVLANDLRGHVALDMLSAATHLYALGPLEGLRGEVSIFDSVPSIARILGDTIATERTWKARACFLVWADVSDWTWRLLDPAPPDLDALEGPLAVLAREAGHDTEEPLPFVITGTSVEMTLHVLDKRDGLPHDAERHEQAKVRRTLRGEAVEPSGGDPARGRGAACRAGPKLASVSHHHDKETTMRLSARNIIKGKILEVKRGATTAHVRIDVGGGTVITSSITNEAVDELGLKSGDAAYAVIKASDVMVAKD